MWQFDMPFSEALSLFSVLSVGDALVAQIPALIISVTAGVVVTRVPGESEKKKTLQVILFNRFLLIVALFNQCRTNARNGDYSGLSYIGLLISGGLPVGDSLKLQKKRTFELAHRMLWELICLIAKTSPRALSH